MEDRSKITTPIEGAASEVGTGHVKPSDAAQSKGVPDFLSGIKRTMAAPKQQYGPASSLPSGDPPTTNPDGSPVNPGDPSLPNQVNIDSYQTIRKEAELWVFGLDFVASRGLKFWSKEGTVEEFKLSKDESEDLSKALADYFATLPQTPKMPAWITLLVMVVMIYGAKAMIAMAKRKASKRPKKPQTETPVVPLHSEKKTKETKPKKPQTETPVVPLHSEKKTKETKPKKPQTETPVIPLHSEKKTKETKPKKPTRTKSRIPAYNPEKPYWEQQYGKNGIRIMNPISPDENEKRKLSGGAPCLNCKDNYCKAGKNACSQHCSGKLKKKSNVSGQ